MDEKIPSKRHIGMAQATPMVTSLESGHHCINLCAQCLICGRIEECKLYFQCEWKVLGWLSARGPQLYTKVQNGIGHPLLRRRAALVLTSIVAGDGLGEALALRQRGGKGGELDLEAAMIRSSC